MMDSKPIQEYAHMKMKTYRNIKIWCGTMIMKDLHQVEFLGLGDYVLHIH